MFNILNVFLVDGSIVKDIYKNEVRKGPTFFLKI
jgi:hypothetical protein